MPDLTTDQLTLALAIVAGVALICVLAVFALMSRLRKVRREYAVLRGDGQERDVIAAVSRAMKQIDVLNKRVDGVVGDQRAQFESGRFALQRFYLVRYDAFEDMGGRLSFSAALLDDHGDGVVITSINGRTETRTYAKPVKALTSDHNLSDEEREAIAGAVARYDRGSARPSIAR